MEVTEPISRKLIHLAKIYLNALSKRIEHLGINRYYYVLALIHGNNGQLTQKALADMLGKDKSAMVSIIDFLTAQGYVYREVNPADRREQLLRTTAKAIDAVPQIAEAFNAINDTVAADLTPGELATFYRVLQKMEANLKPCASREISLDLNLNNHQPV